MARPKKLENNTFAEAVRISELTEMRDKDFYLQRPKLAAPYNHHDVIIACNDAYYKEEIIRNIIDLMADFTVQGLTIYHPVKKISDFCNSWFTNQVRGIHVSERIANYLYRLGNVIINKEVGTLKGYKDNEIFSFGTTEITNHNKYPKWIIPSRYQFLNPAIVHVKYKDDNIMSGERTYYIKKKSNTLVTDTYDNTLLSSLPESLSHVRGGADVKLDPDNTIYLSYKKDDWLPWARPILYSLLESIYMIRNIRLTDKAALQVAASYVRIYKLGSLEFKVMPTTEQISNLNDILSKNTSGGVREIIYGPDIEMIESKYDLEKVLGEEKYRPYLNNIYSGFGIPTIVTGQGGSAESGALSLKVLLNRLDYGRSILAAFWTKELEHLAAAMRWSQAPRIEFDKFNLLDEYHEKALLVQLADRNLISEELLHRAFKHNAELESYRINREERKRANGSKPIKFGPFVAVPDADPESGSIYNYNEPNPAQDKFQGPIGRPVNSKDKKKRKTRQKNVVMSNIVNETIIRTAIEQINEVAKDVYLELKGKDNLRKLTQAETQDYEKLKFNTLMNIPYKSDLTKEDISEAAKSKFNKKVYNLYLDCVKETELNMKRELVLAEKHNIQVHFCMTYNENWNGVNQ